MFSENSEFCLQQYQKGEINLFLDLLNFAKCLKVQKTKLAEI